MSNEPAPDRLPAAPAPDEASPDAAAHSEAQRIEAALSRLDGAVRGETDALTRLQAELAEMSDKVEAARAASAAAAQSQAALLQSLQSCMSQMSALIGALVPAPQPAEVAAAPEPPRPVEEQAFLDAIGDRDHSAPAGQARVPTVSAVVSQLGRTGNADESEASGEDEAQTGGPSTTVAMLETMVEALAASMPGPPRQSGPETQPAAEDTAAFRREPIMPEVELLTSHARIEAMPLLPAELGAAVIFPPRNEDEPKTEEVAVDAFAAPDPTYVAAAPLGDDPPQQHPPPQDAPPPQQAAPAAETPAPEPVATAPQPAASSPVSGTTAPAAEGDLDSMLFEPPPETDPDPAAALLEPMPWDDETPPGAAQPAADPLRHIMALSEEERIALSG